jgi:hypothetical protein
MVDLTGSSFLGLTIEWDYTTRHVDISMPDYVRKALHEFQHPAPKRPTHSPSKWTAPIYGAQIQYAPKIDDSKPLDASGINHVQRVVGKLLYYALAIDNTALVTLNDLGSDQTRSTENTMTQVTHLLNYMATHPDTKVRFYKSDMVLHIHSDGSYLSAPRARSRVGGYFYLSSNTPNPAAGQHNGPIYVLSRILKRVLASAAEVEIGATFTNAQEALPIRQMLRDMDHPQPETPMKVDNTTAVSFANSSLKQKRSTSVNMNYYWIQDRTNQNQFHIYWSPGKGNLGDYHTKHFSPAHHRHVRSIYLHQPDQKVSFNSARV